MITLTLILCTTGLVANLQSAPTFPPVYSEGYQSRDGHRKPFGWQRKPEGPIREYTAVLPPKDFHELHVRAGVPLVYRGAVASSPAIKLWTDEYLAEKYGELDVLVERKKEDRAFTTGRMRFRRFLAKYEENKLYAVSLLPNEMMQDVQAVNSVLCETFRRYTHESNFWMSNGGTRSVIHFDADENFHCLLSGRKDFIVMENKYGKLVYMLDKEETAGSSFSNIDVDQVDLDKYPDVTQVPWTYTTLSAGDCVYLPAKYIHQVRSYGRSIAVTTLFTNGVAAQPEENLEYDLKGCENFNASSYHSMAEIDFHWTYSQGDETVDMGYMNVEIIRKLLWDAVRNFGGGALSFEQFREIYEGHSYGENELDADTVFQVLAEGRDRITLEEVETFAREKLKYIGRAMDPPHGPRANGGEEVFFMPGEAEENGIDLENVFKAERLRESLHEGMAGKEARSADKEEL